MELQKRLAEERDTNIKMIKEFAPSKKSGGKEKSDKPSN